MFTHALFHVAFRPYVDALPCSKYRCRSKKPYGGIGLCQPFSIASASHHLKAGRLEAHGSASLCASCIEFHRSDRQPVHHAKVREPEKNGTKTPTGHKGTLPITDRTMPATSFPGVHDWKQWRIGAVGGQRSETIQERELNRASVAITEPI